MNVLVFKYLHVGSSKPIALYRCVLPENHSTDKFLFFIWFNSYQNILLFFFLKHFTTLEKIAA